MDGRETRRLLFQAPETPDAAALLDFAARLGLAGDACQAWVCARLLEDENPWSLACEGRGDPGGSLSKLAELDLAAWLDAFHALSSRCPAALQGELRDWDPGTARGDAFPRRRVAALRDALSRAETPAEVRDALAETYRRCGVGELALCRAFRAGRGGKLRPIPDPELPPLDAIVGYGQQKRLLVENTAAFLEGRESNHVLLYGDAGTGKSTCVRALLSQFDDSALRLVELQRAQFAGLPGLLSRLRRRGLKFILFLDDLSFEDHETEYKHLKAAIEGGLETMPENVRIYATSNRRHLIRETWSDKRDMEYDEDLHRSDTVAEKLSLAGRFGLNIRFDSPDRRLYYEIIDRLCAERGIEVPADELHRRADAWAIRHGGLSGRTARQFVDDLSAKEME